MNEKTTGKSTYPVFFLKGEEKMKSIKNILTLVLLTLIATSMLACTKVAEAPTPEDASEESKTVQETSEAVVKDYKIAYVGGETANEWYVQTERGVNEWAAETGINAFYKGPSKVDVAMQVQLIEDLIAQDIDALLLCPFAPEPVEPALKRAREKGILVISTEGSTIENVDWNLEAFTPGQYGEFIMQNLAELMDYHGKYITIVAYLTTSSQNQWADAGIAYQEANYPDMELLPERKIESEDSLEVAYERCKEIIKKYPDIRGFFGAGSFDPPAAAKAISEMGKKGEIFACGTSTVLTAKQWLEDGSLPLITFWDPGAAAKAMCNLAVLILDGHEDQVKTGLDLKVEGYTNMTVEGNQLYGAGWIAVTKENMDQYDF